MGYVDHAVEVHWRDVEANLNEQIIKPLVDMNYDVTDGKYPCFRFKAVTPEERQGAVRQLGEGRATERTHQDP